MKDPGELDVFAGFEELPAVYAGGGIELAGGEGEDTTVGGPAVATSGAGGIGEEDRAGPGWPESECVP